jgi:outer membrane protein assembly factor BamB
MKCDEERVYFAGPQREAMVVASAHDGSLQWTNPTGNLQLVLREDAIYAAGKQGTTGMRLAYENGSVLSEFPARRACTRATGCVDSIFYRATGGTVRVFTESNNATHIAPMRPPCQDGVLVSNGHLYWGPWMCGCQLSLYGNICLKPAEGLPRDVDQIYSDALRTVTSKNDIQPLDVDPRDWSVYRGSNARNDVSVATVADGVELDWEATISASAWPTAPVVAGEHLFLADRSGQVHALNRQGERLWRARTGGPIYYPPALADGRLLVGSADGHVYAYDARTGSLLWTFRVAPRESLIPVYGQLVSRWPVAGGVVVDGDTVYAAAGIAHYDGTYVVALEAATGKLKAANVTSGTISEEVDNGISMQGNLAIVGDELQFLGGGVYEIARYDLETLECLNEPKVQVTSDYRTAFYPWYPDYGKYVSVDHTCEDGCTLSHDASYEGSLFTNLAHYEPLPEGVTRPAKEVARWFRRRGKEEVAPKTIWQDKTNRRFTSFAITTERLLATAHAEESPDRPFLVATSIKEGEDLWQQALPAGAVKGGLAIDRDGRIYVAMENGQLRCYRPQ